MNWRGKKQSYGGRNLVTKRPRLQHSQFRMGTRGVPKFGGVGFLLWLLRRFAGPVMRYIARRWR